MWLIVAPSTRHTLDFTIIIIRFILQFLYVFNRYAQTCQAILYICDTECIHYIRFLVNFCFEWAEERRKNVREQQHGLIWAVGNFFLFILALILLCRVNKYFWYFCSSCRLIRMWYVFTINRSSFCSKYLTSFFYSFLWFLLKGWIMLEGSVNALLYKRIVTYHICGFELLQELLCVLGLLRANENLQPMGI